MGDAEPLMVLEPLGDGVGERDAEGDRVCSIEGVAERDGVDAVDMEGVGTVEKDTVAAEEKEMVGRVVLLLEGSAELEPKGALGDEEGEGEGVGERLALGESESRGVGELLGVAVVSDVLLPEREAV